MLSELLTALRGGMDQLRYHRHAHSRFSPWRQQVDEVIADARNEAARHGIDAVFDRRRAYQVARMVVADVHGVHLPQRVPDAYQAYSPPSAATFHDGKRCYPSPAQRLRAFRTHPQTLAYLAAPAGLARRGIGGSPPGGLGVIAAGERLDERQLVDRLRLQASGAPESELVSWARVLEALSRGTADEVGAAAS